MTTGSNATGMPGLPGMGMMAVLGAVFWFGFAMFVRVLEPFGLLQGGARAVMFGRPYLYGVGAAGEMGVDWVVDYFNAGITRTMALVGATDLASLRGTARIGN